MLEALAYTLAVRRSWAEGMRDNDIVGILQPDGRYIIRHWWARARRWSSVDGHTDTYDRTETVRRLEQLQSTADSSILERPNGARLIEP